MVKCSSMIIHSYHHRWLPFHNHFNEHFTIISLKYALICSFDHHWEAAPTIWWLVRWTKYCSGWTKGLADICAVSCLISPHYLSRVPALSCHLHITSAFKNSNIFTAFILFAVEAFPITNFGWGFELTLTTLNLLQWIFC